MDKVKAVYDIKTTPGAGISNRSRDAEFNLFLPFQKLVKNTELMFQFMEMFPLPIEVFTPDGTVVFGNRALMEFSGCPDAGLFTGNYNVLNDPVCNDQMGLRAFIQKAFQGEAVVIHDIIPPTQDLVDRGIATEKPHEKAITDWYLFPIKDKNKLAFVIFVCVVKKVYHGRPEVAKATEYIDGHWKGRYNARVMARSVNMSVAQLYNLFKHHLGVTPGDYYRKVKIERVKEKLADKNLLIKEVFDVCGVNNRSAFVRMFKKACGKSPSEYRNSII